MKINRGRGFAMFAVVFILVVLASAAGYLANMSSLQNGSVGLSAVVAKAELQAYAGLEWALFNIKAPLPTSQASLATSIQSIYNVCSTVQTGADPCAWSTPWHTMQLDTFMKVNINCSASKFTLNPASSQTSTLYLINVYSYATQGQAGTANFVARCMSIQVPVVVDSAALGSGTIVG